MAGPRGWPWQRVRSLAREAAGPAVRSSTTPTRILERFCGELRGSGSRVRALQVGWRRARARNPMQCQPARLYSESSVSRAVARSVTRSVVRSGTQCSSDGAGKPAAGVAVHVADPDATRFTYTAPADEQGCTGPD